MRKVYCEVCGNEIPRERAADGTLRDLPEMTATLTILRGTSVEPLVIKLTEDVCLACSESLAASIQAILPHRA